MTDEMGRASGIMVERRDEYKILMRKPGGKKQFLRPKSRRKSNIKMDLKQ
jgi:hypothetical protein